MSELDEFFKKKDKKKKTAKAKFSTLETDLIARQLESKCEDEELGGGADFSAAPAITDAATLSPTLAAATHQVPQQQPAAWPTNTVVVNHERTHGGGGENQDEEWKPFDSEDNKDYTGLRINIQNWNEDEDRENDGINEDMEKKHTFSWGAGGSVQHSNVDENNTSPKSQQILSDATNQQADEPASGSVDSSSTKAASTAADEAANTTNTTSAPAATTTATSTSSGKYVPPSMRAAQAAASSASSSDNKTATSSSSSGGAYVPPAFRNAAASASTAAPSPAASRAGRKVVQPNLNDISEFPTLGAGPSDAGEKTVNGANEKFEQPKKSARLDQKSEDKMINLENKFNALMS